jgi:Fis family transcriptional regulator, factor for inversion stimulation protein
VSSPALRDLLERLVSAMVHGRITLDEGRRAFEIRFIQQVLEEHDGHIGDAAERLGIHRNTLTRKIAEYRIRAK